MKYITFLISILILQISTDSFSQETRKKRVLTARYIEEYNVLKGNKKIKQGQYIKYEKDILDRKTIKEFGFYENNERIGEWYFFYLDGALKSNGIYKQGLKHGIWKEYYNPTKSKSESLNELLFNIPINIKIDKNGMLIVDKNDDEISSIGVYESNEKIGSWNYYGIGGKLIHKYDHSLSKLTYSSLPDSTNINCPYLGGMDRLFSHYFGSDKKLILSRSIIDSKVVIEINPQNRPVTIERISLIGSVNFACNIEEIIKTIPNEWILSYAEKPIRLTISLDKESYNILLNE
jgi:antitoxin component YwqK of YwqJK toxin-antitoxin module